MISINKLKKYNFILIIVLVSSIIRIISLFIPHDLWWDSSVYIGMGKYIFSFGKIGLWEASRPLVWPIILGFFWKIGLDPVLMGKIMVTIFSLASTILVYFITLKSFNKKIAIFATLFFSFSPTFLKFNNILFSEIPSTFFLLLGVYFFFSKKHFFSGLFLGMAFMTRFFQIFLVLPIMIFYLLLFYKKKVSFKELSLFLIALMIIIVPFIILNFCLYKDPFYPFTLQAHMSQNTGWIFYQPVSFYFINLIKENFFVIFAILGFFFMFKKREFNKLVIMSLFLVPFSFYVMKNHKEMRFLIPLLPFLYIIVSAGLVCFVESLRKYKSIALSLVFAVWFLQTIPALQFDRYDDRLDPFYTYINSTTINGGIWITNPSFIVFSDKKAEELMYYPLYCSDKAKQLQQKVYKANAVLINTCDIFPCPESDTTCLEETAKLIDTIKKKLKLVFYEEQLKCKYYIFN